MSATIVKDWTTKAGLRAAIVFTDDDYYCGYVAVNNTHPLYKKPYNEETSALGDLSPEIAFDVHGGLTFSGEFKEYLAPNVANLWWFGFHCAHGNDTTKYRYNPNGVFRDATYVEQECESLAQQIARFPYTL